MRRLCIALAATCLVGGVLAQAAPGYRPSDNPFQGDYPFTAGQPVALRVEVAGVHLDDVTVKPLDETPSGDRVRCEVTLTGSGAADRKVELTVVLLLEDAARNGVDRVSMEPFKVKKGKAFTETQRIPVGVEALAAAKRVYVFVQAAS